MIQLVHLKYLQAYWRATHPENTPANVPRPIATSPQASPSGDQGRPTLPGNLKKNYLRNYCYLVYFKDSL